MALVLVKEEFNTFDVSGIKTTGKLSFDLTDKNLVLRDEDEAFIKQFIRDRGGAKIGNEKIISCTTSADWDSIEWQVYFLQQMGWVKKEYLDKPEDLPRLVAPDPEKDQVEGNQSYFMNGLERYLEKTYYKHEENDWTFTRRLEGKSSMVWKDLQEFTQIYKDFSKMKGLWIQPIGSMVVECEAKVKMDVVKTNEDGTQEVVTLELSGTHKTKAYQDGLNFNVTEAFNIEYENEYGENAKYSVDPICIWRKRNWKTEIIKRIDDGKIEKEEVDLSTEITVDFGIDYGSAKYEGTTKELEWTQKATIWRVEMQTQYHNYETGKGSSYRHQYIVKGSVSEKKAKANIIGLVMEKIPEGDGVMTECKIIIKSFGTLADIDWPTLIE